MGSSASTEMVPGDFPETGRPISVSVQCNHSGKVQHFSTHRGQRVTSDWSGEQLHEAVELQTGVHRACQRLMFGGRLLEPSCTIQQALGCETEALPASVKLSLLVDRSRFPQRLGPLKTVRVPLEDTDFVLPEMTEELRRGGFYWDMPAKSLERHGLRAKMAQITGQASPTHPITQDPLQREALAAPKEAADFVWSYPVSDWERVESDAYSLDSWEEGLDGGAAVKDFLSVGGFLYFDADGLIVGLATLGRPEANDLDYGLLQFSEPRLWAPEWSSSLVAQGRFQRITIQSLVEMGARMYVWLRPREIIEGSDGKPLPTQPQVPYGGFVYLFHEDPLTSDPALQVLDRYFALALGQGPLDQSPCRAPSRHQYVRSLTLVNEGFPSDEIATSMLPADDTDALWMAAVGRHEESHPLGDREACCVVA